MGLQNFIVFGAVARCARNFNINRTVATSVRSARYAPAVLVCVYTQEGFATHSVFDAKRHEPDRVCT